MSFSHLIKAIDSNDLAAARELLDRGVNVNSGSGGIHYVGYKRDALKTPLNVAILRKSLKAVKLLLASGADPNYQCQIDITRSRLPLCIAGLEKTDNLEILKALVQHGANVLLQDKTDGCIALHKAAYTNKNNALYLIDCCTPEILLRQLYTKNTMDERILDYAIYYPHGYGGSPEKNCVEDVVRERVEKSEHLFLVSESGDLQEVEKCFEDKSSPLSDVNRRNHMGDTALHCASRTGQMAVAKFLLGRNADRLIANDRGCIPLHLAARWNRAEVARSLTSGAQPEIVARQLAARDTDGRTPAQLSQQFGHEKLAEYLNQLATGVDGVELEEALLEASNTSTSAPKPEQREPSLLEKMLQRMDKLEADNARLSTNRPSEQSAAGTVYDSGRDIGECSSKVPEDDCADSLKHQVDSLRQDVGDLGTIIGRRMEQIEARMTNLPMTNAFTKEDAVQIVREVLATSKINVHVGNNDV